MMLNLLQLLHAYGISLVVDALSGRIRYRAPTGALTSELRDLIAEVALEYEERAAIIEYEGGIEQTTANQLAGIDTLGTPTAASKLEAKQRDKDDLINEPMFGQLRRRGVVRHDGRIDFGKIVDEIIKLNHRDRPRNMATLEEIVEVMKRLSLLNANTRQLEF